MPVSPTIAHTRTHIVAKRAWMRADDAVRRAGARMSQAEDREAKRISAALTAAIPGAAAILIERGYVVRDKRGTTMGDAYHVALRVPYGSATQAASDAYTAALAAREAAGERMDAARPRTASAAEVAAARRLLAGVRSGAVVIR